MRSFTTAARSRGWHIGTYCNGTRWVIGHKWICEQQVHSMPAVLHARWQASDGRTTVALANWTEEERPARLEAAREHATPRHYHLQNHTLETVELAPRATLPLILPPLSVALVEYGTA